MAMEEHLPHRDKTLLAVQLEATENYFLVIFSVHDHPCGTHLEPLFAGDLHAESEQNLPGSFSAVSTPIAAINVSF